MLTATKVSDVGHKFRGNAVLWRLSQPIAFSRLDEFGNEVIRHTNYVVTSAINNFVGFECYAFATDAEATVLNWCELPGSQKNTHDHQAVITALIVAHLPVKE